MFTKAERVFTGVLLSTCAVVGVVGYSLPGPSSLPGKIWLDAVGGDVIFDHAYHGELATCAECHHDYEGEGAVEMNCRGCHYYGEKPEEQSGDPAHPRFIGANCTACHQELGETMAACDACHLRRDLAFEVTSRTMPPLPKVVGFDTDGGLVSYDHGLHASREELGEPCVSCHHEIQEGEGIEGMTREKRCRACHYQLAGRIPEGEDEIHVRYIGASCPECHDADDCSTCHED